MTTPTHERRLEKYPLRPRVLEVAEVERITPRMIRVHLSGPDLEGMRSDNFADHVKLWFPDEDGEHSCRWSRTTAASTSAPRAWSSATTPCGPWTASA
ncbi:siderophore-interacting protein [Nocardiopsis changdeensis]|uniref:siderophore-interacting protein n=1 Tax=Nocardiopsis changdeensis TaxID=2831969 RepID=UPI003F451598